MMGKSLLVCFVLFLCLFMFLLDIIFFNQQKTASASINRQTPYEINEAIDIEEFEIALAEALDNIILEVDDYALERFHQRFHFNIQEIEFAKKKYIVVYLIDNYNKKKRVIWGTSSKSLNKNNIKERVREAAETIIHEILSYKKSP